MRYSPVRNGRCSACNLMFHQRKDTDVDWLLQILPAAGLVEDVDWNRPAGGTIHIKKASWVRMFNTEYWRHYQNGAASTNRDANTFTPEKIELIISFYISSGQSHSTAHNRCCLPSHRRVDCTDPTGDS